MKKANGKALFGFIIGAELIGILSCRLSGDIRLAYECLEMPAFAPPGCFLPPI